MAQSGLGAGRKNMPINRLFQIFTEFAKKGKRQSAVRRDVASQDVAWALLMFARADDTAHSVGTDDIITEGAVLRGLQRMLDSFRPVRNAGMVDQ
jgi:hypothetical protein